MNTLIEKLQKKMYVYSYIASKLGPKLTIDTSNDSVIDLYCKNKLDDGVSDGELLKEMRLMYGYNQTQLSEELGIDRVTLNSIERGRRRLTLEEAKRLGDVFELENTNIFAL